MNEAVIDYLRFLCKRKGVWVNSVIGLSKDVIEDWENKTGNLLPRVYKDYLVALGPSYEWLISDNIEGNITSPASFDALRSLVNEILEEGEDSFRLQDNEFVLNIYQRESFRFIRLSEGDDPPVYGYDSGDDSYSLRYEHFTDYLKAIS
jgi:hypothetical protein